MILNSTTITGAIVWISMAWNSSGVDVLTRIDDIISSVLPEDELEGETPVGFTQTGHVCMSPISIYGYPC